MCRSVPDLGLIRESVISVIHSVKDMEERVSNLSKPQTQRRLLEIAEQLEYIRTMIDVGNSESTERVTVHKFT